MDAAAQVRDQTLEFDPDALREKYRLERDKRLRPDGEDQYVQLSGGYSRFADSDPYVEPGYKREPLSDEVDVVVIGGGFSGLLAAARLREAGLTDIRIVEAGGDFGGTGASLTKTGTGTLILSGASTYSGGTTLAGGTLRLANNQALGTGTLTTTGSGVDYAANVPIGNAIVIDSNTTQLQVTAGSATLASAAGPPSPPGATNCPARFWSSAISSLANLAKANSM